jgi:hypothetical protein
MSNIGPLPAGVVQANVNHQFVQLLERALADAKAGTIIGGALILVQADNILNARTPLTFPPTCTTTIVAACEFLKEEVISMVRQQQRGGGRQLLRAANMPETRQ